MNLTNEDVQDILALIDSTNVDELHLRTAHFALREIMERSWVCTSGSRSLLFLQMAGTLTPLALSRR